MGAIIWVEGRPEIEVDGDGVNLTFQSGTEEFKWRVSRSTFRSFVEKGRRMLDADDREQERRVVQYRGTEPG
jgi:hypothetical protein